MKVLDLRTDARWLKYEAPMKPLLKIQQNYANAFENFVKVNKINMTEYDAVIGPEYVRGGTQMAILHKGGRTSPLAQMLRLKFQSVPLGNKTLVPSSKIPAGKLQFRGKIGPGMRFVGGTLISIAVTLLLNWLIGKVMEKVLQAHLQREMEKLQPTIDKDIKAQRLQMLNMASDGKSTYAAVRLHTLTFTTYVGAPDGQVYSADALPLLAYDGMFLSDKDESKDEGMSVEFHALTPATKRSFIVSMKVQFSQEEVDYYRAMKKEIQWYDAQMDNHLEVNDIVRLSNDRNELIKKLNDALAD
ncbi:MAG: hypothetical protein LAQ69_41565 [Acidobacteriia bacterium]|nr:hypothetical protein [Terriglobia bacterium]